MDKMKKLLFVALAFAVIAVMITAYSDNNGDSKPLEKKEYFIILSGNGSLIPTEAPQASSSCCVASTSTYPQICTGGCTLPDLI